MSKSSTSFKKGQSGNPAGRPKGALNSMRSASKEALAEWVLGNNGRFAQEAATLDGKDFCDIYLKVAGQVIPKPREDEEVAGEKSFRDELILRLSGRFHVDGGGDED